MDTSRRAHLALLFPSLSKVDWSIESPRDIDYNCLAFAVGDVKRKWWPDPFDAGYYWPFEDRRDAVDCIVTGLVGLGFEVTGSRNLEPGTEKLAIYANSYGSPQHVARQLPDGRWASKIGNEEDIVHASLEALQGQGYGYVVVCLRRARP